MNDVNDSVIVNEMGRLFEESGVNPLVGLIFGVLFVSESPVSLADIAGRLNVSKAAASIHVRLLHGMGYCRRLPPSADRQHYYQLHDDYLVRAYRSRVERERNSIATLHRLRRARAASNDLAARRLAELARFQEILIDMQNKGIALWEESKQPEGEDHAV